MSVETDKRDRLKRIIEKLHEGTEPYEVKEEFREFLGDVSPADVARIEEELIREGLPREEIRKLCDVHLAVFKESLKRAEAGTPLGHLIHTFMEERKRIKGFIEDLKGVTNKLEEASGFEAVGGSWRNLRHVAEHLMDVESHYVREENVLFPYLEKHGIKEPPAIMWAEHSDLRENKKRLYKLVETPVQQEYETFVGKVKELVNQLEKGLTSHISKEDNILYPTALRMINDEGWREIKTQCDELSYCCFTPEQEWPLEEARAEEAPLESEREGTIVFETGYLTFEEVGSIFNSLPFDLTFVDREDTVRYYSQGKERIFPRTKAVIGRKVQQCHPQKSIHVVNQILKGFKTGERDSAVFWINAGDRKFYIRYFPVRNQEGEYLGCVEVTQDITDIKKIEGEKRLL